MGASTPDVVTGGVLGALSPGVGGPLRTAHRGSSDQSVASPVAHASRYEG